MIRELIRQKFCMNLIEVSVGGLMRRLGFSPQRPLYRARRELARQKSPQSDPTITREQHGRQPERHLKRLTTRMDRKVFLIGDGNPAHKAKLVRNFVEENSDTIELYFLPPYASELNPDKLAWTHRKPRIAAKTREELKLTVESALHRLQKLPEIVASFFHAPSWKSDAFGTKGAKE